MEWDDSPQDAVARACPHTVRNLPVCARVMVLGVFQEVRG